MAAFLAEYLARPGVRITENPSPDGSKVNLVVEAGPPVDPEDRHGPGRGGLTLSAHMDVVPAGEGWSADPFTLTDRGDRWLGRGTADMKGFLTLATQAFARHDPAALRAPLALVFTYDEELGCLGAGHLAATWPREHLLPRNTLIGEPTSLLAVRMHKGHFKVRVTVQGVNAHSGYPHLGVNAIEPAGRIIAALSDLRAELVTERPPMAEHFPQTPYVALNVARVEGGTAINVVPDRCLIELGFRLLPGMDAAPIIRRVRGAIERGFAGQGEGRSESGARYQIEEMGGAPPMLLPEEAPIYRAICRRTGQTETVSASYGTDGGWLAHLGLDCVIFGPGTIEVAHKPDEYLPKAEFVAGARHVEALIEEFCLGGEGHG